MNMNMIKKKSDGRRRARAREEVLELGGGMAGLGMGEGSIR
jgi:hypothetical protein